jgi:hypothetical protein
MLPVKRYPIVTARIKPNAPKRTCRFLVQTFSLLGSGFPQWVQNRALFSFLPLQDGHDAVSPFSK